MFEIGATLREARERQGLALEQVEEATRMRRSLLAALEEERFGVFPSDFYARSFLRGYAAFLGLDPKPFAEEYRERFETVDEPPSTPPRRRLRVQPRRLAWAAALAAAVAGVLLAWTSGGGHRAAPAAPSAPPVARVEPPPPAAPARAARARVTSPRIVLRAARGDCWLSVHAGSARGPLLYEGTLAAGQRLVFARRFLYLRAGAPWNLDVRVNGRTLARLGAGGAPVNALLTPAGPQLQ
jgi:transcriptional regulator with XRE-family HTH domain